MSPEMDAWKDLAKDAMKGLAGAVVVALVRIFRRRAKPRAPLSIASEPDHYAPSRQEWNELMKKVQEMSTTIELHEQELERVTEDRASVKEMHASISVALSDLSKGLGAIQVQLARMGAPPA